MPDNKIKVYELAKTLGVKSVFLMDKMRKEWNFPVKSHMESLSLDLVKKIEQKFSLEKETKSSLQAKKKKIIRKKTVAKKAKPSQTTKKIVTDSTDKPIAKDQESVTESKIVKSRVIRRRKEDQKEIQPINLEKVSSDQDLLSKQNSVTSQMARSSAKNIISDLVSVEKGDSLKDIFLDADKESLAEKEDHKKQPKKPLVEKEVVSKFNPTDFRKREVIFQPKKKRILATGNFKSTQITTPKSHKRILKVHGEMKIDNICKEIGVKRSALMKKIKKEGLDTKDLESLDFDTISLIVSDFGFETKNTKKTEKDLLKVKKTEAQNKEEKSLKPPIVTIMGHVDHGKTTLLDTIRKTKVVEGEAGGITQHIGAYSVPFGKTFITFIDTPGHEAFTAMRARGAKVTDIVIIVVSAADGVMLQTVEAINHAKAAKTPIIIGMTKMDTPGANPDKIKQQMSEHEITPEDWGGDVSFMPLAALKGEGIKELLEQIHLVAEVQELKCQPKALAEGTILEARIEKGRGCVVSLLVQDGTLRLGESFVAGQQTGRVRQMKDDQGHVIKEAGPGSPIEVIGFGELPQAGDAFNVITDEKAVKELIALRKQEQVKDVVVPLTVEELLTKTYSSDNKKELNLILKTDVRGSLEALKSGLEKLKSDNVSIKIVHAAVGAVSESDVLLASAVSGVILGFSVRPDGKASKIARDKSVEIHTYSIIYELLDHVKKMMLGLLEPEYTEEDLGKAEVRNIFHISKLGTVAGCHVTNGQITRNSLIRLVRDGRLIHSGSISSLKRFKDDAKEVSSGLECGIVIESFNDIKPKDILESYIKKEIIRTEL